MRALIVTLLLLASAPASADEDARSVAKLHFAEAIEHYRAGRYEAAMTSYSRAYDTLPMSAFLFNLGQCHRQLGQRDEALAYFRDYLAAEPDAENRASVEALIAELTTKPAPAVAEATVAASEPSAPPAPAGEATPERLLPLVVEAPPAVVEASPIYGRWWFWAIVGGTAAAAAGGAIAAASSGGSTPAALPDRALGQVHVQ